MQPGMPQGFGMVGDGTPIFTLPGNPVSAYVSFCLFVRPALDALQGLDPKRAAPSLATLTGSARSPAGKRSFLRGILDHPAGQGPRAMQVTPVSGQASHQLASLARANALIIVPEQVTELAAGETVEVLRLP
jgi:molybdopterin molybdotransferase